MIPITTPRCGDLVQMTDFERDIAYTLAEQRETMRQGHDTDFGPQPLAFHAEDDQDGRDDVFAELAFCKLFNAYPSLRLVSLTYDALLPVHLGHQGERVKVRRCPWGKLYLTLYLQPKASAIDCFDVVALMAGPSENGQFQFQGFAPSEWLKVEHQRESPRFGVKGWVYSKAIDRCLIDRSGVNRFGRPAEPFAP